jgi:hypothetical protein
MGITGPTGAQGPAGGPTGPTGPQGAQGPAGSISLGNSGGAITCQYVASTNSWANMIHYNTSSLTFSTFPTGGPLVGINILSSTVTANSIVYLAPRTAASAALQLFQTGVSAGNHFTLATGGSPTNGVFYSYNVIIFG